MTYFLNVRMYRFLNQSKEKAVSELKMVANHQTQLSPYETCDQIVQVVKSSNLHFVLQETPHSVYITIRKKFVKEAFAKVEDETKEKLKYLESAYNDIKHDFAEEINSHQESKNRVESLEKKLEKFTAKPSKKTSTGKEVLKPKCTNTNQSDLEECLIVDSKSVKLDQNRNFAAINIPVSNRFEILSLIQDKEPPTNTSNNRNSLSPVCSSPARRRPSYTPPGTPPPAIPNVALHGKNSPTSEKSSHIGPEARPR